MFSSHKKSYLRLLLAAWLRGMCRSSQGIREKAERRRGACYIGIPLASLLSQRFCPARLLQEADGQQVPEKVSRQVPSTRISCQGKACGWCRRDGSREILRVGL